MSNEDTSGTERDASQREVIERKVKADGSVREFRCKALHLSPSLAVVRFVLEQPASFNIPVALEPGTISDGWFWKRQPYSLYRMRSPAGEVVAHRFDAVTDVRIEDDLVSYLDLVLDWWVLADGRIVEEDRDELEAGRADGSLDERHYAGAMVAARAVLGRYRHIIDEVAERERSLGIWPVATV